MLFSKRPSCLHFILLGSPRVLYFIVNEEHPAPPVQTGGGSRCHWVFVKAALFPVQLVHSVVRFRLSQRVCVCGFHVFRWAEETVNLLCLWSRPAHACQCLNVLLLVSLTWSWEISVDVAFMSRIFRKRLRPGADKPFAKTWRYLQAFFLFLQSYIQELRASFFFVILTLFGVR